MVDEPVLTSRRTATVRVRRGWLRLASFLSAFFAALAVLAAAQEVAVLRGQAPTFRVADLAVAGLMAFVSVISALFLVWCLPLGLTWLSVGPAGLRRTFFPFRTTHRWRAGATIDVADHSRGETCQDAYLVWSDPGQKPDTSYGMGTRRAFHLAGYDLTEQFGARLCELAAEHDVTVTARAVYRLCDPVGRAGAATKYNAGTAMNDYRNPHRPGP